MSLTSILCETFYDEENRIWYGPKQKDIYSDQMTLGDAILLALRQNRNKILQIVDSTQEQLTGEDLLRNSLKMCKTFATLGLQVGDVVGLVATNTQHLVALVVAIWLSGAAPNAVYELFDEAELETIYKVTRPKFIFCDVENHESLMEASRNLKLDAKIFTMNGKVEHLQSIEELLVNYSDEELEQFEPPCSSLSGDHTAAIVCSSGTTGPPKGVMISHKALLNQRIYQTLRHDSVTFTFTSLYWVSGFWTLKESLLACCLRVVTTKPFTPDYFMEVVKRYKVTHMINSTVHMTQIALNVKEEWKESMTSIDTIICGGSKVPRITCEKINGLMANNTQRPGFVVSYGMTELSALLAHNYVLCGRGLEGADGKLLPNKIVKILDNEGKSLGINEHGEINIKFAYKWSGYYNNELAYAKVFRDGWFSTGDIGYFDEQGFLYICSRDKDVYKSFNLHVYPEKIESVILEIPGVQEVCVFGIPDVMYANVSACAVVRAKGPEGQTLTEDVIKKTVSEKLPSFYHLYGGVFFFEELPKTGSNKIKRSHIRDIVIKDMNIDF